MMLAALAASSLLLDEGALVFEGGTGPGKGKHIVFLVGDEEYRSEEMLPQLAKILSRRHGFKCTVSFSLNEKGEIDPNERSRQSGLDALKTADLCVMMLRFRQWPDESMKKFVDYYLAGKPIIALRTSTHAFDYPADSKSPYAKYGWRSKEWPGGFGKQVLGETWVSHWGNHGTQATRTRRIPVNMPIFRGVNEMNVPTDVYEAYPPPDALIILMGIVVAGMKPSDPEATGRKKTSLGVEQELNNPMMPIAWFRTRKNESGTSNEILTCTMGSAQDMLDAGFRRFLVNSAFHFLSIGQPRNPSVDFVGEYNPSPFGFEGFRKGVKPADLLNSGLD